MKNSLTASWNSDKSVDSKDFDTVCAAIAYNEEQLEAIFTVRNSLDVDFVKAYVLLMENKFSVSATLLANTAKVSEQEIENYFTI